ncbi:MAG: hypothetical protein ACYS9T_10435 [Planctomycetota bacterium]|jgi:hypothetical protein
MVLCSRADYTCHSERSEEDVHRYMKRKLTGKEAGLVRYWDFNAHKEEH